MKLRIKREAESRGNITLEAALVLPAFMGVLLLFLSVLQIVSARNLLELSVLRTADGGVKEGAFRKLAAAIFGCACPGGGTLAWEYSAVKRPF